jgi:hypothetical protein
VLSPKELALAAADGGTGNGGIALPANGQSFGFNPSGAGTPGSGTSGGYGSEPGHDDHDETSGNG